MKESFRSTYRNRLGTSFGDEAGRVRGHIDEARCVRLADAFDTVGQAVREITAK